MTLFIGTLIIVLLCGLAMGIGLLLRGQPLTGGCSAGWSEGKRCGDCPHRRNGARD
jgi:hypothetical protein